MCPKTGGKFALSISLSIQYFFKQLLRKESALRKSVHPTFDNNVDVFIFCDFRGKIVSFQRILREITQFDAHIFVVGHWSVEVEIFNPYTLTRPKLLYEYACTSYFARYKCNKIIDQCTL